MAPASIGRQAALGAIGVVVVVCAGCSSKPSQPSAQANPAPGASKVASHRPSGNSQTPVPVESNPPGDIPDTTQFVPYRSTRGHFVLSVPEGWSRRTSATNVSFTDKLNSIDGAWFKSTHAPTVRTAKTKDVPALAKTQEAFRLGHIVACNPSCTIPFSTSPISVSLPSGKATVITYYSNSAPNSVTGQRYRLENLRFEFYKNGEEAALTLSGTVGSDNVDPWRLVSQSFRWS
ncbi:MAG: hypothetical protein M3P18_02215 [Actinomycetota bacterium]|nr:hypothetical protein [Actinomycetota bacterium]